MRLKGQVVIVTGASEGIGAALARRFVLEGARVALAARQEEKLNALAGALGRENALVVPTDVTDGARVERMVAQTVERFGGLDVLVNNAGMGVLAPVMEMTPESNRHMWEVNYFGALACTRAALPHLKQRKGLVVNIASIAGKIAFPLLGSYSGTKSALISVSNALRMELAGAGVRVLVVCPGIVDTGFVENAVADSEVQTKFRRRTPKGITPEKVARATLRAMVGGKREIVVPAYNRLLIGFRNMFPRLVDGVTARMMR